ncbi:hypothetical protein JHW45_00035 [Paracoccus stylophorae]|uniref:AAA+ ATPase domain-containing protein n=1 Tax=Paracoccus stylophorae TaxID=659350 RepID=A0ABY7SUZ5_9RHOB|nr:hypothetical protein [Paracoccus stylophorae]WCR10859.1 hypothetical protein JHW45_00035 [Paracoccus stylophorae]
MVQPEACETKTAIPPQLSRAFRAPAATGDLYLSAGCRAALAQLDRAVAWGLPLILLTAAPGTGKTALIQSFAERHAAATRKGPVCHTANRPGDLAQALDAMASDGPQDRLLIVDDAQAMTATLCERVACIASARPGAGLVLVGDDSLPAMLASAQIDGEPDPHNIRLHPLTPDEIPAYLRQRLSAAGYSGDAELPFDRDALRMLFDLSEGAPRFVDHFAERALYEAARDGRDCVDVELLRASVLDPGTAEIGLPVTRPSWDRKNPDKTPAKDPPPRLAAAAAAVAADGTLRADPATAILSRNPDRRGGPTVLLLIAGLSAAAIGSYVLWPRPLPADGEALAPTVAATAVEAALDTSADTAPAPEPAPQPAPQPAAPSLPPPVSVTPEPDPAQLLSRALAAEQAQIGDAVVDYELAALQGNARAAYFLGQLFELGQGVARDLPRAQAWYSVAMDVGGAEARQAELAELPIDAGPTSAPVPHRHTVFASGRISLHWRRGVQGPPPQRYLLEYVPAGGDGTVVEAQTTLSAMLLPRPVTRWRVTGLDGLGRQAGATGWSRAIPPPR